MLTESGKIKKYGQVMEYSWNGDDHAGEYCRQMLGELSAIYEARSSAKGLIEIY